MAVDLATGRVLWTTADLPGEPGRAIRLQSRRFHASCGPRLRVNDRCVVNSTGRRSQASSAESRCEAGDGWLLLPTAERPRPAVSRMARRTLMCYDLPSGRRMASWRAGRQGPQLATSLAPMGSHCSCHSQKSRALASMNTASVRSGTQPQEDRPVRSWQARTRATIYTPAGDRLLTETDYKRPSVMPPPASERGSRVLARRCHLPRIRTVVPCLPALLRQRPVVAGLGGCGAACRRRNRQEGNADRERSQPPMAWLQCFPVRLTAGGWPDRRLAGRWCGGTGTDPIIGSRNRSPHRKARAALPRLDRPCGRLQP